MSSNYIRVKDYVKPLYVGSKVERPRFCGNTFIIGRNEGQETTYLLTCAHCLDATRDTTFEGPYDNVFVRISSEKGVAYQPAKIVFDGRKSSFSVDLAIIEIKTNFNLPQITFRRRCEAGSTVRVIGASEDPFGNWVINNHEGTVVDVRWDGITSIESLKILFREPFPPNAHGISGAPVINENKEVVGYVVSGYDNAYAWFQSIAVLSTITQHVRSRFTFEDDVDNQRVAKEIASIISKYTNSTESIIPLDPFGHAKRSVLRDDVFSIRPARALVVGRSHSGKTTTINALANTGSPVFPTTGLLSCTRCVAAVQHEGGIIFYDTPGLFDEEALENVTRSALLTRLIESPEGDLETVFIIDISHELKEGPSESTPANWIDLKDQINEKYYKKYRRRIRLKKCSREVFRDWAEGRFDFILLVVGSNAIPSLREIRMMRDIIETSRHESRRIFKVYNVWGEIDGARNEIFDQFVSRCKGMGVPSPEEWHIINAKTGNGIENIVTALADRLPADSLRSIMSEMPFSYRIREKLREMYFDYVARVASIIAVFPADASEGRRKILDYMVSSIADMARFLLDDEAVAMNARLLKEQTKALRRRKGDT